MTTAAATIWAHLKLEAKHYVDGLKKAEKATNDSSSRIKAISKSMGIAGAAMTTAVTAPIMGAAREAVLQAKDLESSMVGVRAVFRDSADEMLKYGHTASTTMGMTATEFNKMAGIMGASLRNTGVEEDKLVASTVDLMQRSADMAAVFGTTSTEAMHAFQSAIMGNYRSLDQYGINLSKAQTKQVAMNMGLAQTVGDLTAADYALASYTIVLKETERYMGSFAENSGNMNVQLQMTKAALKTAASELGMVLLPLVKQFTSRLVELTAQFQKLTPKQQENIVKLLATAAAIGPVLLGLAGLLDLYTKLQPVIMGFKAAMTATTAATSAGAAATATAGASLVAVAAPIVAAVAVIGLLVGGLVAYQKRINAAREGTERIIPVMGTVIDYSKMQKGSLEDLKKSVSDTTKEYQKMESVLKSLNSTSGKDYTKNLINAGYYQYYNNKTGKMEVRRRAAGGDVNAGQPYRVGEKGPEVIVPGKSGTVIPNNKLRDKSDNSEMLQELRDIKAAFDSLPTMFRDAILKVM
jgi:hypothetical protein